MADETQPYDNIDDSTNEHDVASEPYAQAGQGEEDRNVKPLFPPMPDLRQTDDDDPIDPAESRSREEFTTAYDIIDQLEQMLEQAKGGIFTPGMVKIDRDEFSDRLSELKKMLPVQLERASALMREAERRLENAQTQANAIIASAQSRAADRVQEAQEQAEFLVGQENITAKAQERAQAIISKARNRANQLTRNSDQYCLSTMEDLHQQLLKLDHSVQGGLNVLRERQQAAAEERSNNDNAAMED